MIVKNQTILIVQGVVIQINIEGFYSIHDRENIGYVWKNEKKFDEEFPQNNNRMDNNAGYEIETKNYNNMNVNYGRMPNNDDPRTIIQNRNNAQFIQNDNIRANISNANPNSYKYQNDNLSNRPVEINNNNYDRYRQQSMDLGNEVYDDINSIDYNSFINKKNPSKEKLNNKHWEKDENHVKNKVNENILITKDNAYNRGLYKFTQIDWSSMKKHNFLTSVGGADVDTETWATETTQFTRNNNRPFSTLTKLEMRDRPQSSAIPVIPMKRISSPQIPEM